MFKKISILGFMLVQCSAFAATSPIVGYGSANSVLPYKNQELFYRGFELGFNSTVNKKVNLQTVHDQSESPIGALNSIKKILPLDPVAVVGFPTSHEAVQVAPITAKNQILTIFPAAGHSKLATFGQRIFTTGESMRSHTEAVMNFVNSKYKGLKGLIVYNKRAVFSANQVVDIERFIKAKNLKTDVDVKAIDKFMKLDKETMESLKSGKYKFVMITMYPDESFAFMDQLQHYNVDSPILTNSSWTVGDLEMVRRTIANRRSPIFTISLQDKNSKDYEGFQKKAKKRFGVEPTSEVANGYDVGVILASTLNRIEGPITKQSVMQAFHQNDCCFNGTSVGTICFSKNGGHANKKVKVVELLKNGTLK